MDIGKFYEIEIKGKIIQNGKRPLVCVSLMGGSDEEVMTSLENILREAKETTIDMVEFRADYYKNIQSLDKLKNILSKIGEVLKETILVFTIRSPKEGGQDRDYAPKTIQDINCFVIDNKLADMVDIELFSIDENEKSSYPEVVKLAKERDVKIIMSNHDFHKTPSKEEMLSRVGKMKEYGADVAKLAVMPQCESDVRILLATTVNANMMYGSELSIVTMSMGELGVESRIYGEVFGSSFTFGAVGEVSAPGQVQVKELNILLDEVDKKCV